MTVASPAKPAALSVFGVPRAAAMEITVFFAAVLLADMLLFDGTRFRDVAPHPFWLFILVVAAHYGTAAGVLATVLGTLLVYAGNLPPRDPLVTQSTYMLGVLGKPVLWFCSAVVLGEIRMRRDRAEAQLRERADTGEKRVAELTAAIADLESLCDRLRTSAAGQVQTAVALMNAASTVETHNADSVFKSVEGLVTSLLSPTSYSVYLLNDGVLNLVHATADEKLPEPARYYNVGHPLFDAIVLRRALLHVASPEGQQVLQQEGVLAGALTDPDTGAAVGMLKIEAMPLKGLRPDTLDAFGALCDWIGKSYRNAREFEQAQRSRLARPGTQLFTDVYYQPMSAFVLALAERARFEVCQLTVRITHQTVRRGAPEGGVADIIAEILAHTLRTTDLAFDYLEARGEFVVLLPLTPAANCQVVADRLRERVQDRVAKTHISARVAITFERLYTPTADDIKPWHRPKVRRVSSGHHTA